MRRFLPAAVGGVLLLSALLVAVAGVQGQASTGVRRAVDIEEVKRDLRQIALAYQNYVNFSGGKAPKKVEDLAPYYENNSRLTDLLKKGTYVFHYNLAPRQMTNGASNTILCYEKDADDKNRRVVAMGDASVRLMDTAEFQKTMKGQGK